MTPGVHVDTVRTDVDKMYEVVIWTGPGDAWKLGTAALLPLAVNAGAEEIFGLKDEGEIPGEVVAAAVTGQTVV